MTTRKLGTKHLDVLKALVRYGGYPNGWKWRNYSTTERILTVLVNRGLASVTTDDTYGTDHWTATDAGRAVANAWG